MGKGTYAVLAGAVIGGELLNGDLVAYQSAFPGDEALVEVPGRSFVGQPPVASPRERRGFRRRSE